MKTYRYTKGPYEIEMQGEKGDYRIYGHPAGLAAYIRVYKIKTNLWGWAHGRFGMTMETYGTLQEILDRFGLEKKR